MEQAKPSERDRTRGWADRRDATQAYTAATNTLKELARRHAIDSMASEVPDTTPSGEPKEGANIKQGLQLLHLSSWACYGRTSRRSRVCRRPSRRSEGRSRHRARRGACRQDARVPRQVRRRQVRDSDETNPRLKIRRYNPFFFFPGQARTWVPRGHRTRARRRRSFVVHRGSYDTSLTGEYPPRAKPTAPSPW